MPHPRAALAALSALLVAIPAEAKRAARKPPAAQPAADCRTLSDSLVKLYDAGDPTYLTWDFAAAECDSSRLYLAYYYQGIGFLFISAWKEALYFLNEARKIGGGKDEEIIYHLWTVYRKLERYPEMERLTLELHQRYPSSLFLMEILDQWKSVKSPSLIAWNWSTRAGLSSNRYLDDQLTNRIKGEAQQKRGKQRFRERASLSLASQWNESGWNRRILHGFQANVGGEYAYQGLSAEADWGAGYESRAGDSAVLVDDGRGAILADSNWNFSQVHLALGYSFTTSKGWNLGAEASVFQLNRDWRVLELSHSQSFLFSDFILMGYLEFQKHWISTPKSTLVDTVTNEVILREGLDGIYTFTFSLTPYLAMGRHSFGAGPNYYAALSQSSGAFADTLTFSQTDWTHSLAATAIYGYDLRNWCRLALTGSSGADLRERSRYKPKWIYSVDASVAFSF
jgi:hypothetical protein